FDPQGFWSSLKKVVSHIPQVVNTASQVASLLPLQAGPQQFAPQGWGGDLINTVARSAGGYVGGPWGQALQAAAPLAQLLPFQAGPQQMSPDFDPQGFWSSLKKVVSHIPQVVNTASQVASLLPLQAGPQIPQQFAPQSWGGMLTLPSNLQSLLRNIHHNPALTTTIPQSSYQPFQA
ncbi:MAG TPA: hypothetical protein VJU61_08830, partial [Polyangiaceae bacterium]|nr:hypothetical protein [Polyangiaceae bacterium]